MTACTLANGLGKVWPMVLSKACRSPLALAGDPTESPPQAMRLSARTGRAVEVTVPRVWKVASTSKCGRSRSRCQSHLEGRLAMSMSTCVFVDVALFVHTVVAVGASGSPVGHEPSTTQHFGLTVLAYCISDDFTLSDAAARHMTTYDCMNDVSLLRFDTLRLVNQLESEQLRHKSRVLILYHYYR